MNNFLDIVSLTFVNNKVNSAIYTDQTFLQEIIVFILGEQLMLGPTDPFEIRGRMFDYLLQVLDPLDKPVAETIIAEIEKRVADLSSELTYRSLYLSGECFLKYEYELRHRFSKLYVYTDAHAFNDPFDQPI